MALHERSLRRQDLDEPRQVGAHLTVARERVRDDPAQLGVGGREQRAGADQRPVATGRAREHGAAVRAFHADDGAEVLALQVLHLRDDVDLPRLHFEDVGGKGRGDLLDATRRRVRGDHGRTTGVAGPAVNALAVSSTAPNLVVNTSVSNPFQISVLDSHGNPVSGASVTYTVTASSGATGSFAGSTTVTTNASGTATAPTFTPGTLTGSYTVTANVVGVDLFAIDRSVAVLGEHDGDLRTDARTRGAIGLAVILIADLDAAGGRYTVDIEKAEAEALHAIGAA